MFPRSAHVFNVGFSHVRHSPRSPGLLIQIAYHGSTPMPMMRVKGHRGWPFGAQAPAPDDCAANDVAAGAGLFLPNLF